jgi:quinol monooxygenase YgiN
MAFMVIGRGTAQARAETRSNKALKRLIPSTRAEQGCVAFHPARDLEDPQHFVFCGVSHDRTASEEHRKQPHFQRYVLEESVQHLTGLETREFEIFETVGG